MIIANELALVVPPDSSIVRSLEDLAGPEIKLFGPDEPGSVPAGIYAHQTLDRLGLLAAIENKTVQANDVRQVLTDVETGNVGAGLVYQSRARVCSTVRIAAIAPQAPYEPKNACPGLSRFARRAERVRFRGGTGSPLQKDKPKPTDPATILCRWPQSIGLRSGYRWPPV